jgi:RHS repeat-associated protein
MSFGGMSGITYGNGLAGSISYDNQYRITGITAGTVMNLSYSQYDANGNITAITNALDGTKNKSFSYDTLDRLSTATSSGIWGSLGWTYDGVGNRQTEGSTVYSYTAGTNKLTGAGSLNFGYDSNGNISSQAARSYTYNQNQRLIQVVDGAMTANYTYNGYGQRVKKTVNGVPTIFHYNAFGQLMAESNSMGAVTTEYVYLNGQPLAKIEGANVYFYHNDHLGTPQKMTDFSGAVVWSADYKPFGEVNITTNTITNNLRFPGQYYDAETGNNYNYFRDYNPMIGRYIEADPIGQAGGINLYVYAGANSILSADPSGLLLGGPGATIGNPPGLPGTTIGPPPGPVIGPPPPALIGPPQKATIKKDCKMNWTCVGRCEIRVWAFDLQAHGAEAVLEEVAHKLAQKYVSKLIPYAGWVSFAYSGYEGINCFVDCYGSVEK